MKTAKLLIMICLILACIVCFASCNDDNTPDTTDPEQTTTQANNENSTSDGEPDSTTKPADPTDPATCEHSYTETVVTRAFALKEGQKKLSCSLCGDEKTEVIPATDSLKVLVLGNSFTIDPTWHLWGVCNDAGVDEIVIGSLFIGGCVLDEHWQYIQMNLANSTYYKNTTGEWDKNYNYTVARALQDEDWDIIAIGHSSSVGGLPETYTNLNNIVEFMKGYCPDATFFFQSPWAFQHDSTREGFNNYDRDQMKMYRMINETVQTLVVPNEYFYDTIPSGTSIQNLRTSYIGDTLTRDGFHMSYGLGRYTISLAWFSILTGGSIENITWVPEKYPEVADHLLAVKEAVNNALANRWEITESKYKTKP